jgi:hypothetical protein
MNTVVGNEEIRKYIYIPGVTIGTEEDKSQSFPVSRYHKSNYYV